MRDKIINKLTNSFSPTVIDIEDVSHQHLGHSGYKEGGESHFDVLLVSNAFEGVSRVKRHQMVYKVLKEELDGQIHALALEVKTPEEFGD